MSDVLTTEECQEARRLCNEIMQHGIEGAGNYQRVELLARALDTIDALRAQIEGMGVMLSDWGLGCPPMPTTTRLLKKALKERDALRADAADNARIVAEYRTETVAHLDALLAENEKLRAQVDAERWRDVKQEQPPATDLYLWHDGIGYGLFRYDAKVGKIEHDVTWPTHWKPLRGPAPPEEATK